MFSLWAESDSPKRIHDESLLISNFEKNEISKKYFCMGQTFNTPGLCHLWYVVLRLSFMMCTRGFRVLRILFFEPSLVNFPCRYLIAFSRIRVWENAIVAHHLVYAVISSAKYNTPLFALNEQFEYSNIFWTYKLYSPSRNNKRKAKEFLTC